MPVEYTSLPLHRLPAPEQPGYELAPVTGLFSIVSPTGTVINLNDLGVKVLAYIGVGMPPVENITTSFGILGGAYPQRTVVRPRPITLNCLVEGRTLDQIQKLKSGIIAQVAPYNSLNSAKSLKLHFQLTNYCGDLIGTPLEVPVLYTGDLTGQTTNLYQDRFDLQFMEYNPPSIKELTTIQPSLNFLVSRAASQGVRYRVATTGEWKFISVSPPVLVKYDQTGNLWYGSNTAVTNRSGTTTQAINNTGSYMALACDINNNVFVGGNFTSPTNFIMVYNGSTWAVPFISSGSPINGKIRAMTFGLDGSLYIGGDFTIPQQFFIKYTYGPLGSVGSYVNCGIPPGNGITYAMVTGPDGSIYIGGDSFVNKFDPKAVTFTNLTGGINGVVRALAFLPDGRLVAGGVWASAAYPNIAVYNGSGWQALGSGLNGDVVSLAVDKTTGTLYASGAFTASGSVLLPGGTAKLNGTTWLPMDISNVLASGNAVNLLDVRVSDGELAVANAYVGSSTLINSASNAIAYTGTADVFPVVKFTGPGTLVSLTNFTTGKSLYFNNYTLQAFETATFTHDPAGGLTFVSSFYGTTIINRIIPGSDKTQFSLVGGQTNYIVAYVTGGTGATKVELIYQNTHWSFEAGAP